MLIKWTASLHYDGDLNCVVFTYCLQVSETEQRTIPLHTLT